MIDTSWKKFSINDFSGGWHSNPAENNQSQVLTNCEITKDKYLRVFYGDTAVNGTSFGSYRITGLGYGTTGSTFSPTILAITNQVKVWAGNTLAAGGTFTDVTGAHVLGGNYWVFSQFVNTSNNGVILLGNESDGLFSYSGGVLTKINTTLNDPIHFTTYQGYVFMVAGDFAIDVSDYLDYGTWPAANQITTLTELGPLQCLVPLPDRLLVVFQRGLGVIQGEDTNQFTRSFQKITQSNSTIYPLTISSYGSEVAMMTTEGPQIISPDGTSTEYIGEPLREFWAEQGHAGLDKRSWRGLLTPFHYILTKFLPGGTSTRTFIYDRAPKTWQELDIPDALNAVCWANTDFFSTTVSGSPFSPVTSGILYGAEDGQIHALHFASLSGSLTGNATWSNTSNVQAHWLSKEFELSSLNVLKEVRRILIQMKGENATIKIRYRLLDGTVSIDTLSGQNLPVDNSGNFVISSTVRLCRSVQLEILADNLELRNVSVIYRDKRFY